METGKPHPDWVALVGNHPGKRDKVDPPYLRGSKPGDPKIRPERVEFKIVLAIQSTAISVQDLLGGEEETND